MPKPIRGYEHQRFVLELDKSSYSKTKEKVEKEVGITRLNSAKILNYVMKKYLEKIMITKTIKTLFGNLAPK